ncbi:MAG: hypothetical protein QOD76_1965, partial [Solirubrobacteraceae bacterium]|nr:hypothetical protein [Solirubrobacteraceae bacterium]
KDMSNGEQAAGDGHPLTLNGTVYPKGLGAHAASDVQYTLSGGCSRFKASVGVDDEVGSGGSVAFQVYADATKVYDSGVMTGVSATQGVDVSVAGASTLRLVVTDGGDGNGSDHADWALARIECATNSPTPVIDAPASTLTWAVGDPISFSGHANDPQDGTLAASALTWTVILHHCPTTPDACHTHLIQTFNGVSSGTFNAPDHEYPSWLELQLQATDSGGASSTTSVRLDPKTVNLNFASVPSGLSLSVGSFSGAAPFTRTLIVNSISSISAPPSQVLGGSTYNFASWSDGGAATHNITSPATSASYTATYAAPPVNTTAPSISGPALQGKTLTTTNGSWSGSTPMQFAYRWRRCDSSGSNCTDIANATASTYKLVAADAGLRLRSRVTATNAGGSAQADSAPTAVIKAR